jgi:hypothetical protein
MATVHGREFQPMEPQRNADRDERGVRFFRRVCGCRFCCEGGDTPRQDRGPPSFHAKGRRRKGGEKSMKGVRSVWRRRSIVRNNGDSTFHLERGRSPTHPLLFVPVAHFPFSHLHSPLCAFAPLRETSSTNSLPLVGRERLRRMEATGDSALSRFRSFVFSRLASDFVIPT